MPEPVLQAMVENGCQAGLLLALKHDGGVEWRGGLGGGGARFCLLQQDGALLHAMACHVCGSYGSAPGVEFFLLQMLQQTQQVRKC